MLPVPHWGTEEVDEHAPGDRYHSVTTILGYVGWYWALAKGGIARIATIQFFQPISGLILAAILLGEQLTLPLAIASAVILAGVYLAQRR